MESSEKCKNEFIQEVMLSMGWKDSFVPDASEENRSLLAVIETLEKTQLQRSKALEARGNEYSRVDEMLNSADNQFDQNVKLLTAHQSQFSTEHHLFKLSEHEETKLKQLIKEVDKSLAELAVHEEHQKNAKEKVNRSMEKRTEGTKWAKSALSEWRQTMKSGQETKSLIEKFCRMDAGRAEALDSKQKFLQETIIKKRSVLVNVHEEQKSLEILLDRTGQLYRQAHFERRQLVNSWKDAVGQMNQREKEIIETEAEIVMAKKVSIEVRAELKREEIVLKLKQDENRELEYNSQKLNNTLSAKRNRFLKLEDSAVLKNSKLVALNKTVQHESQKLINLRNQNRQLLIEEKDKETSLKSTIEELKIVREKYDTFKNNRSSAQEKLQQIEEMLEAEHKTIKMIQDENIRLNSTIYHSEQQLKKLKEIERTLMLEGNGLESGISRTRASCKNLEKELLRQTEILYNVDYNIQHAETRKATMKGAGDGEETKRLDQRRQHLETVLQDKFKADELMKNQIARTEEDMRKLSNIYQVSLDEFVRINGRLNEKTISVEGGVKQQKILHQQNQAKLVERNLLKLRIAQMENQIANQTEKSYSLERHQMELEVAMNERLVDIKSQLNLLNMKQKCLQEERSQLKADLGDRVLKIEQFKIRYALSMDLLGKNDDGTTITAVQIKVQVAQEKHLLLNKGNEMKKTIVKAEYELKCLENTLKLMNFSNGEYRKGFEVTKISPEEREMNELQNKIHQRNSEIKELKKRSVGIISDIELLEITRIKLDKDFEGVQEIKLNNNDALLKVEKGLVDQEIKLERAEREMKKSFKAAKLHINNQEFICLLEKDIRVKELDERINFTLQTLADLSESIPDLKETMTLRFLERGLCLPSNNVSRTMSQSSRKSEVPLSDQSLNGDSHASASTPSRTPSINSSKKSIKVVTQKSNLHVVKITFPELQTMDI